MAVVTILIKLIAEVYKGGSAENPLSSKIWQNHPCPARTPLPSRPSLNITCIAQLGKKIYP